MQKPFLKWPGGKFRIIGRIQTHLVKGKRLVEPFVGSGAVFLNADYDEYLLADTNPDLINLYQILKKEGQSFIDDCRPYFCETNNDAEIYYEYRALFNETNDVRLKSILFIYLNRHCYNGLCRYNSKNEFNSPFGRYKKPYFPEDEMLAFHNAAQRAEFIHANFEDTMKIVKKGDVVYCDPPYAPLSKTAYFTDYFAGGFDWQEQISLANWAEKLSKKGIPVIISNHDTSNTRKLYKEVGALTKGFKVRRNISCNAANRNKIGEILAVFNAA